MKSFSGAHGCFITIPVLCLAAGGCAKRPGADADVVRGPRDGGRRDAGGHRRAQRVARRGRRSSVATLLRPSPTRGPPTNSSRGESATHHPPTGGRLEIPEDGYARLGPGPGEVRLDVFGADAQPGQFVDVEFVFEDAPRAEVQALVQHAEGDYEAALDDAEEPTATPF